jgi:hypothetical protein
LQGLKSSIWCSFFKRGYGDRRLSGGESLSVFDS